MIETLEVNAQEFSQWPWAKIEPLYQELLDRKLSQGNLESWLGDWTRLASLVHESLARLELAATLDTTDEQADQSFQRFLDEIFPPAQAMEQKLKEKLLASGLQPEDFEVPMRNMRAEAELFREENLPLLSEEKKLGSEYDKIIGAQTVEWEGKEVTVSQLRPVLQDLDRSRRERAWRLGAERQLADREAINRLWQELLSLRLRLAANAGLPDYRAYRWREMLRFDYTPENCEQFHQAIEAAVVPAAQKIYEKRRKQLGVDTLRPWDLEVDPLGREPLKPYQTIQELEEKGEAIFRRVDPQLGEYYATMRREGLLDLDNRKGKAPGAYCTEFLTIRRPFIFANSVGLHDDVQTLLHESGHAFHVFEIAHWPYHQQMEIGYEFAEVASMGMELLAAPYLTEDCGGFYTPADAARARIQHLESCILFWPYMAVVDAFQHWAYTHPEAAMDPVNCDAQWGALWGRFMAGVDWTGLEEEMKTGWHRKLHIYRYPFYYVEYGLAQLGAMQVWRNALANQAGAVAAYRRALALGGTVPLPDLYAAAGARFAFDAGTLGEMVDLAMDTIARLES